MKHVLCATDLSERSDRAIRRAFRLATQQGARLTVLTIVDSELPVGLAETLREDAATRLERYCADMAGQFACDYAVRAELGDPAVDLAEAAQEADADLVVIGLHRRRRILDRLRGTTMERIVRASNLPVLVVRDPADHDYRAVLAPVDFSPAAMTALHLARALAPDATITAFHALYIPFAGFTREDKGGPVTRSYLREVSAQMKNWATSGGLPEGVAMPDIQEGGLTEIYGQMLGRRKPDLIAIGAHARSGLAPYMLGSFAASLVRDPPCDLLVTLPQAMARDATSSS